MKPYRHLPGDLHHEIFCRLPVKSLVRFRCVSKLWLFLVDKDANFARLHLKNFKKNSDETRLFVISIIDQCTVRWADTLKSIFQIPSRLSKEGWDIVSSVDGLLLLSKPPGDICALWNPSLRQFREVPPLHHPSIRKRSQVIGLGYDLLAKDYKIVSLIYPYSVGIYTVGAGSWNIIPFQSNGSLRLRFVKDFWFGSNVNLHGMLYFLTRVAGERFVVSFDLSKEVFSPISLLDDSPVNSPISLIKLLLVDGGSSVAMAMYDRRCNENSLWVLERETMNWTKRRVCCNECSKVWYIKKNGNMLTTPGFNGVATYNSEKHKHRKFQQRSLRWIVHVSSYVESLFIDNKLN